MYIDSFREGKAITKVGNRQDNTSLKSKHIDGFVRQQPRKITAKTVHATPQRAKTLMRSVVKKPKPQNQGLPVKVAPSNHDTTPSGRLNRAKTTQKSTLVSRFGLPVFSDFKIKPNHAHIPVKEPPTSNPFSAPASSSKVSNLQAAIENADSHVATKLKKPSLRKRTAQKLHVTPKTLNLGMSVVAAVLLFGFFAYQNIPNIAVRVAAARAGITATMPQYVPSGFSLNEHITYRPGQINIKYKSNTDDRQFHVTQTTSAWDSEALLENFVASNQQSYQTYQDKGKTIYIYNGSNATWVDRGVWYQIEGSSSLNSDQLIRLANSM